MTNRKIFSMLMIASNFLPVRGWAQGVADKTFGSPGLGQLEASIAVSPSNFDHLAVSFMSPGGGVQNVLLPLFFSSDGGNNWFDGQSPLLEYNFGDPIVAFDVSGRAYHASLSNSHNAWVTSTTDFGITWSSAVNVNPNAANEDDKPHLATDVSGTRATNAYAAWTDFAITEDPVVVSRSTNSGATWIDKHVLTITGASRGQGAHIAIGPSGEVYVAWANYEGSLAETGIGFAKSTDGGENYSNPTVIVEIDGIREENDRGIPELNNTRAASFPYMDVDRSNGPRRGWIYIVYPALGSGSDIFMNYSSNGGTSWDERGSVNGADVSSGKWQWMPSLAVDPLNGNVVVSYYSMDQVGTNFLTNRYLAVSTNGGQTFTRTVVSDAMFNWQGNQGGAFAGDYYETAAHHGKNWATWSVPNASGPMSVRLELPGNPVSVSVQQRLDGSGSSFGYVDRWLGLGFDNALQTPWTKTFFAGTDEILRGEQEIVSTQKYNNWNALDDVTNHHKFGINQQALFISNFRPTVTDVTIRTELLDAPSVAGGIVQFKDPWYIDFQDALYGNHLRNRGMTEALLRDRASPFSPNYDYPFTEGAYKGVFLNQRYDIPNNPYYSVGAPNPQNINGFTSYFENWVGGWPYVSYRNPNDAQTDIVFLQSGVTATALYKAHLGSSAPAATGSNGQRKLARNEDLAPYNLCYESAGEIYFTSSEDAETWDPELRISNGSNYYSAPSIATFGSVALENGLPENDVYMICRRWDVYNHKIYSRVKYEGSWLPQVQVNSGEILNADPHPVIARTNTIVEEFPNVPQLLAVWEEPEGLISAFSRYRNGQWDPWMEWSNPIAGTGCVRPSLASTKVDGVELHNVYLTYDNSSDIFITYFYSNWIENPHWTVPASIAPTAYASQVAGNTFGAQDVVHVVWEAVDDAALPDEESPYFGPVQKRKVMYQNKTGEDWGPAVEFRGTGSLSFYRPSVMPLANGAVVMSFDNGNELYRATNMGGGWSGAMTENYNGTNANLVNAGTSELLSEPKYAATMGSAPPYRIHVNYGEPDSPAEESLPEIYSRRVVIAQNPDGQASLKETKERITDSPGRDSAAHFSVELSRIELRMSDGSLVPLNFVPADDSLPGWQENDVWKGLTTERITVTEELDSVILDGRGSAVAPLFFAGRGENAIRVSFEVIDANSGNVLRTVGLEKLFTQTGKKAFRFRERLHGLTGREVIIRPRVKGVVRTRDEMISTLVHVHTVLDDSASKPVITLTKSGKELKSALPTQFALHQNYPNPFNPSTTINYDLPEPANVSLIVFDILGREVAELVNGTKEAGYHAATWNASAVASGVYFARFTATDANGTIKLSKVNKLLLAK